MDRKLPIRTYERKRVVPVARWNQPRMNNYVAEDTISSDSELSKNEKKEVDDVSLDYDPFDTTFDRIARNARTPLPPPEVSKDKSWLSSTNSFEESNVDKVDNNPCLSTEWIDLKLKPSSAKKKGRKKKGNIVLKGSFQNKNKNISKQAEKNISWQLRSTINRKKRKLAVSNLDNESSHSDAGKSSPVNGRIPVNKVAQVRKKCYGKANTDKHLKKNKESKLSSVFGKLNPQKHEVTSGIAQSNRLKNAQKNFSGNVNPLGLDMSELSKATTESLKNMKQCFIQLDRVNTDLNTQFSVSEDKSSAVMSSTPVTKPRKPSIPVISISPIPSATKQAKEDMQCFVQLERANTNFNSTFSLTENEPNAVTSSTPMIKLKNPSIRLIRLSPIANSYSKQLNVSDTKMSSISANTNSNKVANSLVEFEKTDVGLSAKLNTVEIDTSKSVYESSYILPANESVKYTPSQLKNIELKSEKISENSLINENSKNENLFSISNCIGNIVNSIQDRLSVILISPRKCINSVKDCANAVKNNFIKTDKSKSGFWNAFTSNDASKSLFSNTQDSTCDAENDKLIDAEASSNSSKSESSMEPEGEVSLSNKTCDNESLGNNLLTLNENYKNGQVPASITVRRKRYLKWDVGLSDISENTQLVTRSTISAPSLDAKKMKIESKILEEELNSLQTSVSTESNYSTASIALRNSVYLKPGKLWTRSLSILNHLNNQSNLDELSIGKGKKWRQSVKDVLDMQNQGVVQSCIGKNEDDQELRRSDKIVNTENGTYNSINLGRLSKRISIRVIPLQNIVKSIDDSLFLEAYGIIPISNEGLATSLHRNSSNFDLKNDFTGNEIFEYQHKNNTARDVVLQRCNQKDYIAFSDYFTDSYLSHCRKIGEGVYGEVFLYERMNEKCVIKIIPVEGDECINGEPQKKFHEILSEIVISKELYNLRFHSKYKTDGFVEVKSIKCIIGKYPEKLLELWNIYDEEKNSDNDCPSVFDENQLYIVLELGHGGQDLEAFVFHTAEEAHNLFIQIALALAIAEKAVEFEHRDLHWGNILISRTEEPSVHYKLESEEIILPTKSVKVSIIDFTLSRMSYQECSIFNDLASDPTLFTAQGEYQFEIYRLMRDKVENNWKNFEPYTNILWLHYTLDKMITAVRYKKKTLKVHKNAIKELDKLKNEVLTYTSSYDFITNCDNLKDMLCIGSI